MGKVRPSPTSRFVFNTVLPFRWVQRNRNRAPERCSWLWADIYKFFMASPSSRRKYLVEVHAYPEHLYTVDFYAKVDNADRYRLRTHQFGAGRLGGTVLAIMAEVLRQDPAARFGFLAAAMRDETSDSRTKRFKLYTRMMEQKLNPARHTIVTRPENSSIFVLPNEVAVDELIQESIIKRYECYFAETF